jgi:hypothetical protein
VIGKDSTGTFIGVDANGKAVGDNALNAKAEAAIETVKANEAVDVDLTPYMGNSLIANSVKSVKKTASGTYLIEIKTTGNYDSTTPIVINVVIDASGKILDAQTVSYGANETPGDGQLQDGKFNTSFIGKTETEAGEVDTVAGVTFTTTAYKNAILNAFNVVKILGGEDVDTRTEEEKFADALAEALPGSDAFTKVFLVEVVDGFDAIYKANNGAGYVCVIGKDSTGTFVGVDANGAAVGESVHNAKAEAAVALITSTTLTEIDFAQYKESEDREIKRVFRQILSINKTATGNYVIVIKATGYGSTPMEIKVSVSADGKIIDNIAISNSETPNIGGVQLGDGKFNSNFIGKTETEAGDVDTVGSVTVTTDAYKTAILRVFTAITTIEGGAN